jgi:hypothetical protein
MKIHTQLSLLPVPAALSKANDDRWTELSAQEELDDVLRRRRLHRARHGLREQRRPGASGPGDAQQRDTRQEARASGDKLDFLA